MINNKKIFFVVSRMHGGGAQKVILHLLNYLSDYTDWDVTLILFKSKKDDNYLQFISPKCKIEVLNSTAKTGWFGLYKIIKNKKPDVVFSTLNYINISVALATILSNSKLKLIIREARPVSKTAKSVRILQRIFYWRANVCWAITPEISNELNTILGISKDKIFLAPNPLNLKEILEQPVDLNKIHNDDVVKILYVGRLIELKNIDCLIEALDLIKEKNWHLKIVGNGVLDSHLKMLVDKKGLNKKIQFVGFSNNPYQYMLESDIFCLPSKFEGFPNVVTEALACGNLCIANDTIGGGVKYIKELVETVEIVDFNNFAEVADKISYYIENKTELNQKKILGATLANELEMDKYYIKYLKKIIE